MPFRTDDPIADFERHDWKQARMLAQLPTCDRCGYQIQQEMAVRIYGYWFCDECITECREEVVVGIMQDGTPNRFQRLKETHPRQYEYCIGGGEMVDGKWQPNKEGLGLGHVLDYIGVKYD